MLLGIYGYWEISQMQRKKVETNKQFKVKYEGKAAIGGPWSLVDANDNQWDEWANSQNVAYRTGGRVLHRVFRVLPVSGYLPADADEVVESV